jgi:hypothetical protein
MPYKSFERQYVLYTFACIYGDTPPGLKPRQFRLIDFFKLKQFFMRFFMRL